MSENSDLKQKLETAYRANKEGFLARAKKATRNVLDAEDAVQEAFVSALSRLNVLGRVENLPAWLFTVIRNRLTDFWRRRKTRREAGETDVGEETIRAIVAAAGLDPADELVREELSDALADAISSLPRAQRDVIESQVVDEMTFRELSEKTGEPVNTLMTRKKLAIKKLAVALRGWIEN